MVYPRSTKVTFRASYMKLQGKAGDTNSSIPQRAIPFGIVICMLITFLLFLCCLLADLICLPYCYNIVYCIFIFYQRKVCVFILYWNVCGWTCLLVQRNTCTVFHGDTYAMLLHLSLIVAVYMECIICKNGNSVVCCMFIYNRYLYWYSECIFVNLEYKYIYYQWRLYITLLVLNKLFILENIIESIAYYNSALVACLIYGVKQIFKIISYCASLGGFDIIPNYKAIWWMNTVQQCCTPMWRKCKGEYNFQLASLMLSTTSSWCLTEREREREKLQTLIPKTGDGWEAYHSHLCWNHQEHHSFCSSS